MNGLEPVLMCHRPGASPLGKSLFLDRDGVLVDFEDKYLISRSAIKPIPGSAEALRVLSDSGYSLAIVTNQSCVSKGYISLDEAIEIHCSVVSILDPQHEFISWSAMCPHDSQDQCSCRKPQAGMIESLGEKFSVRLPGSWLVGDSLSDMECGKKVESRTCMVHTGLGKEQISKATRMQYARIDMRAENLFEAAQMIARITDSELRY